MEIILLQDLDNLGNKNDLVTVKNGYGINYLLPRSLAVVANTTNKKVRLEEIKQEDRRREKFLSQIQDVINKLQKTAIQIGAKVGTTEKIFGSVTTHHLADEILKQTGIKLDRKQIVIEDEVKTLGSYIAKINLYSERTIDLEFDVIPE